MQVVCWRLQLGIPYFRLWNDCRFGRSSSATRVDEGCTYHKSSSNTEGSPANSLVIPDRHYSFFSSPALRLRPGSGPAPAHLRLRPGSGPAPARLRLLLRLRLWLRLRPVSGSFSGSGSGPARLRLLLRLRLRHGSGSAPARLWPGGLV